MNSKMFLLCRWNSGSLLIGSSLIISEVIQAFDLAKYWQLHGHLFFTRFLQRRGFSDLPITIGCSFSPVAFKKKTHVFLCLHFIPPLYHFPFTLRLFSGTHCQKLPVCIFQTSLGFQPLVVSPACSFQLSTVFGSTPSSPTTVILQILCYRLKDLSHPFEAAKLPISRFSAII